MNISYQYEIRRYIQLAITYGLVKGALLTYPKPSNPYLSRLTLSGLVNKSKALIIIF